MVKNGYSAENLTAILNAFRDMIFILDDDGTIVDYLPENNSQWLYVPKEQFVGKHYQEVLPPHVSEKIDGAVREIRQGTETCSFDYNLEIHGNIMWFTAVFSPVRKDGEALSRYLCSIREITQRKEKELLLQGVLDNAFNPFIVFRACRDHQGRVTDLEYLMVNHPAEKMTGKRFGDLHGKRATEIPGQPWILFNDFINVAETGKPLDLEYSFHKGDSKVWVHTHASRLENDIVVTVQDITEKKLADINLQNVIDQLQLSRHHMDLFFSQALSGFFLMMLDKPMKWDDTVDKESALDNAIETLHFTRVNSALLEQYGATEKELMSRSVKDFFKDDLPAARKLLRELYDKGRIYMQRTTKKLDGSDLFLEGHYIALTDDQNNILGHFGIQRDVTEQKWSENALRASEERYRLLANNMMDFVALHDPDGTYRYVSPSVTKILGYTPEELIGTSPYPLFHAEDIPRIQTQSHVKAVSGSEVTNIEYRIKKKDGSYIWFSTSTKPITDAGGRVTMLQTVSRDVTERIETLHLLEELNQQKNKLFSIIAHDLRGPLASCMGLLNLTTKSASRDDLEKYVRLARKSAFNLHELMEDLLLWA
ncbi:MAG TPA: PAS domain S-box protein, partial [Chryseosolibacter sp.]